MLSRLGHRLRLTPEEVIYELDKIQLKFGKNVRLRAAIAAAKCAIRYQAGLDDTINSPIPVPDDPDLTPYPVFRCPICKKVLGGYKCRSTCPDCSWSLNWR